MAASMSKSAVGSAPVLPTLWRLYERMDGFRAGQGRWLESLGWGPQATPSRIVLQRPGLELLGYAPATASGPPVLLLPAPIKQAYIWDLAPGASVVRACLERGFRPYLLRWREPVPGLGLADYADRLPGECLAAIRAECGGEPVVLAGHSLGGIFSAICAALHADEIAALVILGSPLHFSLAREEGALGPVVETVEKRGLLEALPERMPGSLMSQAGLMASPAAFARERLQDWMRSLGASEALRTHMRVERWSLDELPLSAQLIRDLVHRLYRSDGLVSGTLRFGDRRAGAEEVRAPLAVVLDRHCQVVPPAAVMPFYKRAASPEKRIFWYEGDIGVAIRHVGMLVGKSAHAQLWPELLDWVRSQVSPRAQAEPQPLHPNG